MRPTTSAQGYTPQIRAVGYCEGRIGEPAASAEGYTPQIRAIGVCGGRIGELAASVEVYTPRSCPEGALCGAIGAPSAPCEGCTQHRAGCWTRATPAMVSVGQRDDQAQAP